MFRSVRFNDNRIDEVSPPASPRDGSRSPDSESGDNQVYRPTWEYPHAQPRSSRAQMLGRGAQVMGEVRAPLARVQAPISRVQDPFAQVRVQTPPAQVQVHTGSAQHVQVNIGGGGTESNQDLRSLVTSLQNDLFVYQAQMAELVGMMKDKESLYETRFRTMQEKDSSNEIRIRSMQDEITGLRQAADSQTIPVAVAAGVLPDSRITDLQNDLAFLKRQIADSARAVAPVNRGTSVAVDDSSALAIGKLSERLDLLEGRLKTMQPDGHVNVKTVDYLVETSLAMGSDIENLKAREDKTAANQASILGLTIDISSLTDRVSEVQALLVQVRDRVGTGENKFQSLLQRLTDLEESVRRRFKQIHTSDVGMMAQLRGEIDGLRTDMYKTIRQVEFDPSVGGSSVSTFGRSFDADDMVITGKLYPRPSPEMRPPPAYAPPAYDGPACGGMAAVGIKPAAPPAYDGPACGGMAAGIKPAAPPAYEAPACGGMAAAGIKPAAPPAYEAPACGGMAAAGIKPAAPPAYEAPACGGMAAAGIKPAAPPACDVMAAGVVPVTPLACDGPARFKGVRSSISSAGSMCSTSSIGDDKAILIKYEIVLAHISREARNMDFRRLEQLMKGSMNGWIGFLKSLPFPEQSYLDDDDFVVVSRDAIFRSIYADRLAGGRDPCVC